MRITPFGSAPAPGALKVPAGSSRSCAEASAGFVERNPKATNRVATLEVKAREVRVSDIETPQERTHCKVAGLKLTG
jgi:hypothetical protein